VGRRRGAAAYGRSAAWLWGLLEEAPDPAQVVIPHRRRCHLDGIDLHRSRDLTAQVVYRRHGIPAVDPLLTMVHLGACPDIDADALSSALEVGLNDRFSMRSMFAALDRYGRPGCNGIGRLRRVVGDRALEEKPADSQLEVRCADLLRHHGIEGWVFHHHVRDGGRFVAEPDFAFVGLRLAVEVDGAGKLRGRGALDAFFEREHRLAAAGWQLVRFTWAQVVRRPGYVASVIRQRLGNLTDMNGGPESPERCPERCQLTSSLGPTSTSKG
jgi:very-short-patch-repair endonuclease